MSERRLLNYAGLAAYLSVSVTRAKALAAAGEIPKVMIGGSVRFDVQDADLFIDRAKKAS